MTVRRFPDPESLSIAAAEDLAALVLEAVAARGTCHLALAGGSTPARCYELLAAQPLPWDRVQLWWGDGRTAPMPEATYRRILGPLADVLSLERVLAFEREPDPVEAAAQYERALVGALGDPPALDVVVLGLGGDGHTASLMPGSAALAETARWVVADGDRITLTAPAVRAAHHVRFLVAGADKAAIVATIIDGPRDPARYPAQLITDTTSDLVWLVDDAAAGSLG